MPAVHNDGTHYWKNENKKFFVDQRLDTSTFLRSISISDLFNVPGTVNILFINWWQFVTIWPLRISRNKFAKLEISSVCKIASFWLRRSVRLTRNKICKSKWLTNSWNILCTKCHKPCILPKKDNPKYEEPFQLAKLPQINKLTTL